MRFLALGEFDLSRNFLVALAELGHEVAYGYLGKPRMPESRRGLTVFRAPKLDPMPVVMERIRTFRPDVLYVGSAGYDGSNALAMRLIEANVGVPLIRVYKEFLIQANQREGEVLNASDGVVLHSEYVAGYFRALYGLPRERVHIYDHDVIADRFIPAELPDGKLSDRDGEPHVVLGGTMKHDRSGYDFRGLIADLADRGVHVHVYPVTYSRWLSPGRVLDNDSAEVRAAYQGLWDHPYVHREEILPQAEMVSTWSRYDAGIMQVRPRNYVPTVTPWQQMDHPSKHSFYLAAGLPLAVDRAVLASLREDLAPHGVLLDYRDADELASLLRDRAAVTAASDRARQVSRARRLGTGLPDLLAFIERVRTARAPLTHRSRPAHEARTDVQHGRDGVGYHHDSGAPGPGVVSGHRA